MQLMLVDDDRELIRIIERTLELEGYSVNTASNGPTAIEQMKTCNPDLVLLDIMMPGMDGYEVLQNIRKTSTVPVLMLTALGEVDSIEKCLQLGADGYITKPFRSDELVARVKAMIRRSKSGKKT
jgi:DNA-binding response OmpR family regulator